MKINVAHSKSWKDRETGERCERTDCNTMAIFNNIPGFEYIRDNLQAGDLVHIEAEVMNTSYEKEGEPVYGVSIIADRVSITLTGRNPN